MSYHIDRAEFDAAIEEDDWDYIWAAYQYAVNGGETSVVERFQKRSEELEHDLNTTQKGVEEAARRFGWSEEANCPPWSWLETVCVESRQRSERLERERDAAQAEVNKFDEQNQQLRSEVAVLKRSLDSANHKVQVSYYNRGRGGKW